MYIYILTEIQYISLINNIRWKSKVRVPKRNLKINETKDEILPLFLAL